MSSTVIIQALLILAIFLSTMIIIVRSINEYNVAREFWKKKTYFKFKNEENTLFDYGNLRKLMYFYKAFNIHETTNVFYEITDTDLRLITVFDEEKNQYIAIFSAHFFKVQNTAFKYGYFQWVLIRAYVYLLHTINRKKVKPFLHKTT